MKKHTTSHHKATKDEVESPVAAEAAGDYPYRGQELTEQEKLEVQRREQEKQRAIDRGEASEQSANMRTVPAHQNPSGKCVHDDNPLAPGQTFVCKDHIKRG